MREYVFMNLKKYKRNKCIECIKINSDMVSTLKYKYKRETISELINFINKTFVIGYDISNILVQLLTDMYELKMYNCVFHYYDLKESNKNYRVFRGLNYSLYLLDNGYYVYDKGNNKLISYYIHKKELKGNLSYTD